MVEDKPIRIDPLKEPATASSITKLKSIIKDCAPAGVGVFFSSDSLIELSYSSGIPQTKSEAEKPEEFIVKKTIYADLTSIGEAARTEVFSFTISLFNHAEHNDEDDKAIINVMSGRIPGISEIPEFSKIVEDYLDIMLYSKLDKKERFKIKNLAHEERIQKLIQELEAINSLSK